MRKVLYLLIILSITLIACVNKDVKSVPKEPVTELPKDEETVVDEADEKEEINNVEEEEESHVLQEPLYVINNKTWSIEPIDEETDDKVVLITIDDAPDKYALEMAKILEELDVPAIFFVNGHFLETDEDEKVLKELDQMGFVIGNHTYSHRGLSELSKEEQTEEIITVNDQVEEIIGKRPIFFRAPFGQNTDYSRQIIEDDQMVSMNWSYGYDWNKEYMDKNALVDVMVNAKELRPGANLLMHDRKWTAEALEEIILGLRNKGYDFVDPMLIKTVD